MTWYINKISRITQTTLTDEMDSMAVCPSLDSDGKEGGCDGDLFYFAWKQHILVKEWTTDLLTTLSAHKQRGP